MNGVPPSALRITFLCLWLSVSLSGHSVSVVGNLPVLGSLSQDLLSLILHGDDRPVRAIARGDVDAIQSAAASSADLSVVRILDGFVAVEAPPTALQWLASVPGVAAISRDLIVQSTMSVSDRAMAADQARAATKGLLGIGGTPGVNGRGIGVAVVDSGIAPHAALKGKVVAAVNFATGTSSAHDEFGHGTHIAGIIAGLPVHGRPTDLYNSGIAPGAHLVNVRVLGPEGLGYTSDVIAGIQWVITNRATYGIRVVNLSLGHPVAAPCAFDPLCLTAESAVAAGLVVVVSAGNDGQDAAGRAVLGSISTPGNAPGVITVGALNTQNTISRADDTVAGYSSRGPTRYDMGLKPDVVAPGHRIVSLEAAGSYLFGRYPSLHVSGSGPNAYGLLSGTSMAAGMVSGGAALLLEAAPSMTARYVKVALQLTASPMLAEGLTAAGTGSVNLHAARKAGSATQSLLTVLPTSTIGGQLVQSSGLAFAPGAQIDQTVGYAGLRVLGLFDVRQPFCLLLVNCLNPVGPAQIIWDDVSAWTGGQQIVWGQVLNSGGHQIVWGQQIFNPAGHQIVWGQEVFNPAGQQIVWGQDAFNPAGQQIVWGQLVPDEDPR